GAGAPGLASVRAVCAAGAPRDLLAFPTRRSSDLRTPRRAAARERRGMSLLSDPRFAEALSHLADYLGSHLRVSIAALALGLAVRDRKSTRLNSSHVSISYAVFCLKQKTPQTPALP